MRCPDFREARVHWFKTTKLDRAARLFSKLREAARRHASEARTDNPWMRYYAVHVGGRHVLNVG